MNCTTIVVMTPSFPEASSGSASGPAGGDLAGTYPNPTISPTAIHGKTEKLSAGGTDELLIWDATTGTLRRITITTILAGVPSYTDEQAQDAIGSILTASSTVAFTYNDVTPSISADVLDGSITSTKLANDAVTALKILNGAVTDAKLRDSAATSLIGRSLGTAGVPGDIVASADEQVLRRLAGVLGFGQITTGGITNGAVTFAKIQDIASTRLLGRSTSGTGPAEEISIGSNLSLLGGVLSATISGWGSIVGPTLTTPFTVGAGTTLFVAPYALDPNPTETVIEFTVPRSGTARNLLIAVAGTQPSGGSLTFTVRKNGVDTALQAVVPASGTTGTYSNTANTVTFAAGDKVTISIVNAAAGASITIKSIAFVVDA